MMEYIQSALLLHSAGKEVNEENLTQVLEAAGVEVEESRVKSLVAALEDVDIDEAIKEGQVPTGGAPAPEAPAEESEEEEGGEEEEEKEKQEEEAEAAEGLGSLFKE